MVVAAVTALKDQKDNSFASIRKFIVANNKDSVGAYAKAVKPAAKKLAA